MQKPNSTAGTAIQTFSAFLGKTPGEFVKAGLVDQPLDHDERRYIDVVKFKDLDIEEFKGSYKAFLSHFSKFFTLVQASKRNGLASISSLQVQALKGPEIKAIYKSSDPAYKAAYDLLNFREVDGFNLGYSESLRGASIGPSFKVQLIKAAQELLALDIHDPEVFCLLPFLQEGIGCDRISDMFISINYLHFISYTERRLKEIDASNIRQIEIEEDGIRNLAKPDTFKNPLILIPKKLTKQLPMSYSWADIFDSYDENSALRSRLNSKILSHFKERKEVTKANVSSLLKRDPDLLKDIIKELKETTPLTKLEKEVTEELETELKDLSVPAVQSLKDQILFIINRFKAYVERKGLWKLFYHRTQDENGEKVKHPLSEEHVQRAFYVVADLIAEKFDVEVIPEAETGVGSVDFKFAKLRTNVLVEVKLTTHRDIKHGLTTQLEEYIASESPEHSFYLLVKLTNSDTVEMKSDEKRLVNLQKFNSASRFSHKDLVVVDATIKVSASKK